MPSGGGHIIRATAPLHFDRSMASHDAALMALRQGDGPALQAAIIRDIGDAADDLMTSEQGITLTA